MPLDNSAATSAQNLLNGINYSALIGGPLEAAIKAQAMAARSTWEFIQEVGLNTDSDGQKSAVNVTFLYQKDGELVRLVVPILTIVPIPLIIIDEVDIAFKANIHASASQATEESSSQAIAGELGATGKIGWGPFSLSATLKASYSSKKDSKATQNSEYSVEYTQDVHVHATQAGMPAGLATVLNILSNSAGEGSRDGTVTVSPAAGAVDSGDPQAKQSLEVTVLDANGLRCEGVSVTIAGAPPWLKWGLAPFGQSANAQSYTTDAKGRVSLLLWVPEENAAQAAGADPFQIEITATPTGSRRPQTVAFPVRVFGGPTGAGVTITTNPASPVRAQANNPTSVTVSASGVPAGAMVALSNFSNVTVQANNTSYTAGTRLSIASPVTFTFTPSSAGDIDVNIEVYEDQNAASPLAQATLTLQVS